MKTGSRPQYYRIRRMVQMVREGSAGGKPPNCTDFTAEFGVSRRTVARDLDFLRDEERAPLEYDEARHGFRLTDETYALPPVSITRREAFSFGLARKLLAHYEGTPLHLDMRSVLDKIAESLAGDISVEPAWLSEHVGVLPEDRGGSIPRSGHNWRALWSDGRRSGPHTRPSTGAFPSTFYTRIICSPITETGVPRRSQERSDGEGGYVLALNTAKDQIATFALSRFRQIATTGQTFRRPADFNAETYAKQAFGIVGGEAPIKVRLLFESKLAVYITERDWHPSQEFQTNPDGRVEMRLETTGRKELVRWILSWMPDVKVLEPESLRARIVEKLQDGLRAQESRNTRASMSSSPATCNNSAVQSP